MCDALAQAQGFVEGILQKSYFERGFLLALSWQA
jgi:hypothetical protein